MIKVKRIPKHIINTLLYCPKLEDRDRKAVYDIKQSQFRYPKLTRSKYIYFWLLYNKYFDLEYDIQHQVYNHFGRITYASKKGKEQKDSQQEHKGVNRENS